MPYQSGLPTQPLTITLQLMTADCQNGYQTLYFIPLRHERPQAPLSLSYGWSPRPHPLTGFAGRSIAAHSKTSGQNIPPQFRTKWTVSIARYTSFVMSLQPPFALKCLFSTKLFLNLTKPFVSRIVCLLMSNQLLYYVWQLSSWMSWPLICC